MPVKILFQYIRFFFFIAFNWNLSLAFFMLYHDVKGKIRYGITTFQREKLADLTIHDDADISKSSPYEAVNYFILEKLLAAFRKRSNYKSIVDLGCGKGRVMAVASHFGFINITGIDFAKELCDEATRNMQRTGKKIPGIHWTVIHSNVLDYNISPGDSVFFMFNPFVEETIVSFLDKLEQSCKQFPRKTYFLYASPQHTSALIQRGYRVIFQRKFMFLKGLILEKN